MENIGCVVLDIYQDYLDKYPGKLAQVIALQLLFDVRFIVGLFVTRDNKVSRYNVGCKFACFRDELFYLYRLYRNGLRLSVTFWKDT